MNKATLKIATMATGGLGGFLAVRLTQIGHQVATIARGAHLDTIKRDGLILNAYDGIARVNPWIATSNPAQIGEVDAIIFAVKGDDLEAAAKSCIPMIGPDTVVIPFLNGVEAADRLVQFLPAKNVANGVAYISTTIGAPGVIYQTGEFNRFVFGERDNQPSPRIDALRDAINMAGSSAPATTDIDRELWIKFILFAAVSGVTAGARTTMGDIVKNDSLAILFRAVISETAALARTLGVNVPSGIEMDTWSQASGLPPSMRASTAIDLEAGRPLEIEWISGAVKRLSFTAGLDAPINATIYALLSPYMHGNK